MDVVVETAETEAGMENTGTFDHEAHARRHNPDRLANLAFQRRTWRKQRDAAVARILSRSTFLPIGLVGPVREYDACCAQMRHAAREYADMERADAEQQRRYLGSGCAACGRADECPEWCPSARIREEFNDACDRIARARRTIGIAWDSAELARVLAESEADDLADRDDTYPAKAICVETWVGYERGAAE